MFIIIFIVIATFAVLDFYLNKNLFASLAVLLLICVAGLRSINTGLDTYNYYFDYNSVVSGFSPINSQEKGYILLEKLFSLFNSPVSVFFFFISALTLILLTIGYSRLSITNNCTAFLLLYYYSRFYINRDLNQIRASLAASIILCSLIFVYGHKPIKFFICILVATLIHSAAIIALIIYPVFFLFKKISKQKIAFCYIVTLILSSILSIPLSPFIKGYNNNRLNAYINDQIYISGNGLKNPIILLQILISLIGLYYLLRQDGISDKYMAVLVTYMISTVILILLSQYSTLAGRTSTFFATVEPIVVMDILTQQFGKKLSSSLMIIFSLVIFILINYSTGGIPNLNYQFL